MKGKLKIEGLECANCARTLENEINKIDGVKNARLDFASSTLKFESENLDDSTKKITLLTKKLEPQARVSGGKRGNSNKKRSLFLDIACLFAGIAILVLLLCVSLPTWAFWLLYVASALLLGWKTYIKAVRLLFRGIINENLLITISVIGASVPGISEHLEGLWVVALYSIGKLFEGLAVDKSRRSIEALAQTQPDSVTLLAKDEKGNQIEKVVSPEEVKIGSLILVRAGEKIALDGIVESGQGSLDTQSLTGESLPQMVKEGESVLSGAIVLDSPLIIRTTTNCKESTISKIMNLVENATENKSKTETFISKITKWYTLGVVILAVLVFGIVWAVTKDVSDAFYRGLTFLVVSCPCAFAISVPLTYFSGLGSASRHGILVKGSNHLDTCARANLVAFDKTGTLTTGQFSIQKITSYVEDLSEEDVLFLCALGEQNSLHPLAKAIMEKNKRKLDSVENVKEISGYGIEFSYNGVKYFVGRKEIDLKSEKTTIELFKNEEKIGEIQLSDSLKSSSKETCEKLRKMGVKTVMLSGDNAEVANKIASEIGMDEAYGKLLPQDKFSWLEKAKESHCVAYVGDGLNDAPALATSDVGICMGISGSPASIEAADVVLVDDDPKKIVTAIRISKRTKKIVWENIILSAIVKITFLTLGALGITGMMWAVFADVGVTVLAILNSLRALTIKNNE